MPTRNTNGGTVDDEGQCQDEGHDNDATSAVNDDDEGGVEGGGSEADRASSA